MGRSKIVRAAFVLAFVISSVTFNSKVSAQAHRWGDIIGPVTPTSLGIFMPTTLGEVARLQPDDNDRIRAAALAQLPQVEALIAQGLLIPQSKIESARPMSVLGSASSSGGRLASVIASHLYSDARCSIDWQGFPFTGTYVWGWGQTVANAPAAVHAIGDLYQNGAYKQTWGQELDPASIAQGQTDKWWVAWWDHPTFVNNSDHWIKLSGTNTYDWGPWYCSVTHTV